MVSGYAAGLRLTLAKVARDNGGEAATDKPEITPTVKGLILPTKETLAGRDSCAQRSTAPFRRLPALARQTMGFGRYVEGGLDGLAHVLPSHSGPGAAFFRSGELN